MRASGIFYCSDIYTALVLPGFIDRAISDKLIFIMDMFPQQIFFDIRMGLFQVIIFGLYRPTK